MSNSTNVFLMILSVLIPLVGFVLYFTKKSDEPDAAKVYGCCGIAGAVIGLLLL